MLLATPFPPRTRLLSIIQAHDPVKEHTQHASRRARPSLRPRNRPLAVDPLQHKEPWAQARLNAAPVATVLRAIENIPQAKPLDDAKLASLDARITKLEAGQTHTTAAVANVQTDLHKLQHKVDTGFADFRTTLTDGLSTLQADDIGLGRPNSTLARIGQEKPAPPPSGIAWLGSAGLSSSCRGLCAFKASPQLLGLSPYRPSLQHEPQTVHAHLRFLSHRLTTRATLLS